MGFSHLGIAKVDDVWVIGIKTKTVRRKLTPSWYSKHKDEILRNM